MGNKQLSHLALMGTETGTLHEIDFEDLVIEFVKKKTCKVSLIIHDFKHETNYLLILKMSNSSACHNGVKQSMAS